MTQWKKLLIAAAAIVAFVLFWIGLYSTTKNDTEKNNQAALQRLDEISKRLSDIGFRVEEINGQLGELDYEKDNLISEQTKLNDEANVLFLSLVTPEMVKAKSPDDSEICPIELFEKYEWDCVNHLDEQKPEMFPEWHMDVVPAESKWMPCLFCSHYDADTNSCIDNDDRSHWCEANFPTDTLEEWIELQKEPVKDELHQCAHWNWETYRNIEWRCNEDWMAQDIPALSGSWRHERMKELLNYYWVWDLYDTFIVAAKAHHIYPELWICIAKADTSLGKALKTQGNIGNVWNTDSWATKSFDNNYIWVWKIFETLNNQYLGNYTTVDQLSRKFNKDWKIYAGSEDNWHNNVMNCLGVIYDKTLPDNWNFRF